MQRLLFLAGLGLTLSGCASMFVGSASMEEYQKATAGSTGCNSKTIKILEREKVNFGANWTAECAGDKYYCVATRGGTTCTKAKN